MLLDSYVFCDEIAVVSVYYFVRQCCFFFDVLVKGVGGGLRSKFYFLIFFHNLKIQNMELQNLFTELKKKTPLLRYGVPKLGPISQKIAKCMGKYRDPAI